MIHSAGMCVPASWDWICPAFDSCLSGGHGTIDPPDIPTPIRSSGGARSGRPLPSPVTGMFGPTHPPTFDSERQSPDAQTPHAVAPAGCCVRVPKCCSPNHPKL
uniref:Uncharacterized protein n=1 Tax=Setaria viridis TaxID=4556 RepID=A0A4V6DFK5_SETVI|nr:hypothetical protein SEVIR_1G193000v2 [Setaria viridis]